MKMVIPIAFAFISWVGVFAQGKVTLAVDTASLITLDGNAAHVLPQDAGLAGQPIGNAVPLPSGVILTVGLYAGTNSTSLSLQGAGTMDDPAYAAGVVAWSRVHHIILNAIPGIASGTQIGPATPWFQVRVWESAFANYELTPSDRYHGQGAFFQMNPGNALAYPTTAPPSVNSTWVEAPIIVGLETQMPAVVLEFQREGDQLVLSWPDSTFRLQAAPFVNGTYTNVFGATSPYTNIMFGAQQFFRLRQD